MKLREPKCDCEHDRLAQRMAKLEEKLFSVMERNAELEEENSRLRAEVADLKQQLAAARKDSSTSSKPPSSDIVKPKKPPAKGGKKRKKGGQPGHDQHLRSPFPPEAVDHFEPHTLDSCPDCGGRLVPSRCEAEVLQQVEITETPTVVTEHRGLAYWCPHCRKVHYAPMPEAVVKAGLFGPRLTALVAFMKGVCHASFSTIRKFLRDVVRVQVSRGYLAKLIHKVSQSLAPAYAELFERLPGEAVLNVDETGHKENGQKFWTWCFRAQLYTLFRIDKSRGSKVLVEVLGEEFNGVLGCDYFTRVPDAKHARNLAKRFRENGEAYFRFITTPGIDPTNHLAEQAIRFVVIDRHITQGTRSEKGRRWCERIWTVMATCAQRGRAVFQFLLDSVQAHLCGTPPPSLLPSGT